MSQKFRSDVSSLADDTLENLEARCRQLAVDIDIDASAVDLSDYKDIYIEVVPEIIRYIRLLERNIDRHEARPVCKQLREDEHFFDDDELEYLQVHCCIYSTRIHWGHSPDVKDDLEEDFPRLIRHARLLERRMDQYEVDIISRLQKMEQAIQELWRRVKDLEDVGNSPQITIHWLIV